ncbi:hypothetical protein SAMN05421743_105200 [Thalassobacillus cyri]|uniref:Uncharacterized protein n=1 Tax=Thalassobacillus cyri TaxID=571932 RepID=A0A1H4BZ20_9BACI|nr:hypothetical protein [Thalassobacillus cyri]SEA53307.1 hypothetical protein SAMN05421743_105200 [Thalassobacillus cyri]
MEQMELFEDQSNEIPKAVLSPIECNKKLGRQAFVANQRLFGEYVKMIQNKYHCSWFEARKIFFENRDHNK